MKRSRLKRTGGPKRRTPRRRGSGLTRKSRIRSVSKKESARKGKYEAKRRPYLEKHPRCEVNAVPECTRVSVDVHHMKGKIGDLLLDERWWMPTCRFCHGYIEDHPAEARQRGWSKSRY